MFGRRFAVMGVSVFLAAAMVTVPAFAHGHHSRGHHRTAENGCAAGTENWTRNGCAAAAGDGTWADNGARCPVCLVDGCTEIGHHLHEQSVYCGYPHEHGYCDGSCILAGEDRYAFEENNGTVTEKNDAGSGIEKETDTQIPDTRRPNSVLPDVRYHGWHHWAY